MLELRQPVLPAVVLGLSLSAMLGCGGGTLKVTKLAAATQRPSNVAVYLRVVDRTGQPVGGLQTSNFRVYEDRRLISENRGKRALLDTGVHSARYALLLVDLSGPVVESPELPELARSVGQFVDTVGAKQTVAVSAFDGADAIAPLFGFGAKLDGAKAAAAVKAFHPRNRASNLNGAVYQALHLLKAELDQAPGPEKSGELVIFTDRGDLAHGVTPAVLEQALKETPVDVYVIATGAKVSRPEIAAIGHSGIFVSNDPQAFKKGFDQVTARLAAASDGRYLFSYCTPKRHGNHKLDLVVSVPGDTGRITYPFDATGLRSGCSPQRRPDFATEPPPDATAARD